METLIAQFSPKASILWMMLHLFFPINDDLRLTANCLSISLSSEMVHWARRHIKFFRGYNEFRVWTDFRVMRVKPLEGNFSEPIDNYCNVECNDINSVQYLLLPLNAAEGKINGGHFHSNTSSGRGLDTKYH